MLLKEAARFVSSSLTHLFQFVHQACQASQSFQIPTSLIGYPHEPMEGVIQAVVELRGHSKSRPTGIEV